MQDRDHEQQPISKLPGIVFMILLIKINSFCSWYVLSSW